MSSLGVHKNSKPLDQEIAAFERKRSELERHHMGKFVVIKGDDLVGTFDTLDAAADEAIRRFGRGPYLIRQVGARPVTIPLSLAVRHAVPI